MGQVHGEWYDHIRNDVNDPEFLRRFQSGMKSSPTFRGLQIAPGNYGECGDQDNVAQKVIGVDLSTDLKTHESPIALFEDPGIRQFSLSTPIGCAKQLVSEAVICSAKLNFALDVGAKEGFFPLADANPYGDLLGAKYARAINALEPSKNNIQITDLSFAIFDELISAERLRKLSLMDIIRYRKESEKAREALLELITSIQTKQAAIGLDGDYAGTITKLIDSEIRPAVQTFKNRLQTIDESLVGAVARGAVGTVGASVFSLFGDLSLSKVIVLSGAAAGYMAKAVIDAILAERAAKRECSISYIMSLDE